jgi:lipid-binding SYLF domain-containing protein
MTRTALVGVAMLTALLSAACDRIRDDPEFSAGSIVDRSIETIERMRRIDELRAFTEMIPKARGVVILPSVTRAGFIGGAEGGNGILLARDASGGWGYPAFYTLASGSVGLQIGIQNTEIILVIRNDKALNAILQHQGTLGADAGLTMGFIGIGAEAATTTALGADVVAFSNASVGLFIGASLDGSALVRRKDLNEAFYGAGATPSAITLEGKHQNPRADRLRAVLAGQRG